MPLKKDIIDGALITAFTPQGKKRQILNGLHVTQHSIIIFLSILGNPYCTEAYLHEILRQAMDKKNNLKVTCLITDEIYWHNLKGMNTLEEDISTLKHRAIELGSEFLERNLNGFLDILHRYDTTFSSETFIAEHGDKSISNKIETLNQITKERNIPFEIMRWQAWENDLEYKEKKERFATLVQTNEAFQGAIEETSNSFVRRQLKEAPDARDTMLLACTESSEKATLLKKRAWDYVSEECFALFYLAAKRGFNLIAYPGRMTKAFRTSQQFFITDHASEESLEHADLRIQVREPRILANWVEIKTSSLDAATVNRHTTTLTGDSSAGLSPTTRKPVSFSPIGLTGFFSRPSTTKPGTLIQRSVSVGEGLEKGKALHIPTEQPDTETTEEKIQKIYAAAGIMSKQDRSNLLERLLLLSSLILGMNNRAATPTTPTTPTTPRMT